MRRSHALSALAGGSVAAALGLPARGQTLEKVRVTGPPTEDFTSMYYALKSGAFQRAGLDVEITPSSSGAAGVTAVIGGAYEITRTSLPALLNAHLRGLGMLIVLPANLHDSRAPLALLQIPTDSSVKTGADLNGKTIGVPSIGDLNTISIRAWVDKNGGDWKSLKFVEITNSALEPALVQHRVDAAILQAPHVFSSLTAGTTKTLGDGWGAIAPRFFAGVYVARGDWASAHQATLKKMGPAYLEANLYVNGHPAETAALAAEITKIDTAAMLKMRRVTYGTVTDPAMIQPVIDAAAKYDAIPRAFPAREIIAS
jgi:NitT/TauT family transport system substrate-binding protein